MKIVLNIFSRAFIALYAILTLIAVIAEMKEIGFQSIHLLYFIGAILLISATVKNLPWLVYLSLLLMIPLVIFTGYIVGNLQLSHIIIRILITVLLSLIYGCSVRWVKVEKINFLKVSYNKLWDSFQDKHKSFYCRKKLYKDCHSDRHFV